MFFLTEIDISQNFVSTCYISLPEINDSLQHSCQSFCDQEGSWDCQSNFSSYHSTSEIWLQEEAAHVQSENTLLQQQFLQSYNTFVVDYIENSNSGKYQSYNPSTCTFSVIARKEESNFELIVEEGPLCGFQIQISPKGLHEHTNPSFLVEDEKDDKITISPNI